jgi:signal transduction histidine kinase/CheY-like chemotaxis protein
MPFNLLNENYRNKISTSQTAAPLIIFAIGTAITLFLANAFFQSEVRFRHSQAVSVSREAFKLQNLTLINNILKQQSFIEMNEFTDLKNEKSRNTVKQLLHGTEFTHADFVIAKKDNSNATIFYYRGRLKNKDQNLTPVSDLLRAKIELIKKTGAQHTLALDTMSGNPTLNSVWRLTGPRESYIIFSSPVEYFFEDWPSNPRLSVIIKDDSTGASVLILRDPVTQKISAQALSDTSLTDKSIYRNTLVSDEYGLRIDWFQLEKTKPSTYVLLVAFTGLILTGLISLFARFVLNQNRHIYQLVVARTDELEKAMVLAQQANRAKTRFLANMSHELRTPLNLILGMLEVLQSRSTDDKEKKYIQSMQGAGRHLLNLITDLLTMSKDEVSDIPVQKSSFKTLNFFEDVASIIRPECKQKDLTLVLTVSPKIPETIYGDAVKTRQIILYLLRNALKYTEKGAIAIHVAHIKTTNEGSNRSCHLRITVSDTGPGIPEEKMKTVFNNLFHLENSFDEFDGRVGLGLSIVRDLTLKLNGNISVKSEPGKGSSFAIDLDFGFEDQTGCLAQFSKEDFAPVALVTADTLISNFVQNQLAEVAETVHFSPEDFLFYRSKNGFSGTVLIFGDLPFGAVNKYAFKNPDKKIIAFCSENSKDLYANEITVLEKQNLTPTVLFEAIVQAPAAVQPLASVPLQIPKEEPLNVLVVDDDAGNRELLEAYLEDTPYKATFSVNGAEAFELYKKTKPDMILADLRMPLMNGFELAAAVRDYGAEHHYDSIPFIILTADALVETSNESKKYPVSIFLTKPIRRRRLLEVMNSLRPPASPVVLSKIS